MKKRWLSLNIVVLVAFLTFEMVACFSHFRNNQLNKEDEGVSGSHQFGKFYKEPINNSKNEMP